MIVERLKNIATLNSWKFNYGDYQWQNLLDLLNDTENPQQQVYLLLLWKDVEKKFNEFNGLISETYEGEFLLVVRSELQDEDYNYKYEERIKELEALSESVTKGITHCEGFTIDYWKQSEVVNQLDTNVDGLKIKFRIKKEL